MNQNQRYECLIGIHRVFMPYGMNRGEYAAKPRQQGGVVCRKPRQRSSVVWTKVSFHSGVYYKPLACAIRNGIDFAIPYVELI